MNIREILIILLIILGLTQSIGFITSNDTIRGVGQLTVASPLPLVFNDVNGVETFASDFFLTYTINESDTTIQITPKVYAQWDGAYNWRNVYGAAISYGPILPKNVTTEILDHGFCNGVLQERITEDKWDSYEVLIKTKTNGRNDEWRLTGTC